MPAFRIEKFLGEGGIGRVYLATREGRKFALKFLRGPRDPRNWPLFQGEVGMLSRLSHPHLVKICDFFPEGGKFEGAPESGPYFVMEYLSGRPLDQLETMPPPDHWPRLLAEVCHGLHYLHSRNILHRDLKPANLFLTDEGKIKVLDFSLSRGVDEEGTSSASGGTPLFMAPEAFVGDFDFRSDLFSLAATLYAVLTGRKPFPKALFPSALRNAGTPVPLQKLRPDLPEFFCDLLHRLLAIAPRDRPSSALTVLRYLKAHVSFPIEIEQREEAGILLQKVPMVGRDGTFEQFDQIHSGKGFHLLALVGPTGVGRSRWLEELKWRTLLDQGDFHSFSPAESEAALQAFSNAAPANTRRRILVLAEVHLWSDSLLRELKYQWSRRARDYSNLTVVLEFNSDFQTPKTWSEELPSISLPDLAPQEARELLAQAVLGMELSPAAEEEILRLSGGRPALILAALGQLNQGSTQIPKTFEEASRNRVAHLSENARGLLALLLAHSETIDKGSVSALWEYSREDLETSGLELEGKEILLWRGSAEHEVALVHPSLKSAYWGTLAPEVRSAAHRRWIVVLREAGSIPYPAGRRELMLVEHAIEVGDVATLEEFGLGAMDFLYAQGSFERAAEISASLLDSLSIPEQLCRIHAYRGPILSSLGRYAESLAAYDQWFALRADDASQLQKVKYELYRGLVNVSWGKREESLANLSTCLRSGDAEKYPALRPYHAKAQLALAALAEKSQDWDAARAALHASASLGLEDPLLQGEIEQRLGKIDLRLLEFEKAREHFAACREYYQPSQNPETVAIAFSLLGNLSREQGDLAEAVKYFQAALDAMGNSPDRAQRARHQGNLGLTLLEKGEFARGMDDLADSAEILRYFGNEEDRFIADLHLATAFRNLGNFGKMNEMLERFSKNREKLIDLQLWPAVLLLSAESAIFSGNETDAQKMYSACLAAIPENDQDFRIQAELGIYRLRIRQGNFETNGADVLALPERLSRLKGPIFSAWRKLISLLGADLERLPEKEYRELMNEIEGLENLEMRRELYSLLALALRNRGLMRCAEEVSAMLAQGWQQSLDLLPEEYRMDYEKNRTLMELDASLPRLVSPKRSISENSGASLQIPEERFRQFCGILRQVAQKARLEEILERVMDAAIELSRAERGFLILKSDFDADESETELQVKTARRFNQRALKQEEFQFSHNLVRQAMQQGVPVLTENAEGDDRFSGMQSVHQFQLKSILAVPLELEGRVLGAIYLDNPYRAGCFSPEDVSLISGFASQAALAIQKARMMEELKEAKGKLESQVQVQEQKIELLSGELSQARKDLKYEYKEIVGQSPAMMQVFQLLDHVTRTKIPVWVWGESGTGKELVARSLHDNSNRKQGSFVSENCGSIPETLIESELFGHKKGAFTHADRDRVGLFEQADKGTLFLDEIADMPASMQVKLLRVLQEGEIRPVGSNKKIPVDVRLVTASNRNLEQLVKEGKFREDLFYRINGITIPLPPLRERREDIPLLVHHLVKKISREFELKAAPIQQDVLQHLMAQAWPGNIRQLEGVLRNLLLFAHGKPLTLSVLSLQLGSLAKAPTKHSEDPNEERQKLIDSLARHNMDKAKVAEEFSITLKSVYARMQRWSIPTKKSLLEKFMQERNF